MPAGPIPIWFGGGAEPQLRRAARLGDGFLASRADERAREPGRSSCSAFLADEGRADAATFAVRAGMLDWAHGPDACAEAADGVAGRGRHAPGAAHVRHAGRAGSVSAALGYTTVDEHLERAGPVPGLGPAAFPDRGGVSVKYLLQPRARKHETDEEAIA